MPRLTLLLIPLLFFMTSCSIDWSGEKDKKIAELEKQIQELKQKNDDELFKKNIECSKLENEILRFSEEFYGSDTQVRNIFYSPIKKSCLFIVWTKRTFNEKSTYVIDIMDILSKESIYGFDNDSIFLYKQVIDGNCGSFQKKCDDFNLKIKELKGE